MNGVLTGALVAFGATALLVPVTMWLARRLGAMAVPRSDRISQRIVPTLGGLAIAAGVVAGLLAQPGWSVDQLALCIGLGAMVALGLADDVRYVPPPVRLLIESGIAIFFTTAVTGALDPPLRLAAIAIAAVAVPVAVNATNLVDNSDGLAASLSLATGVTLVGVAMATGLVSAGVPVSLVVAGACLAFLLFNLPPARIFMGDTGSLMLGFTLAAASILLVRDSLQSGQHHALVAAAIPLAWSLQIGDLVMVFATRLRRGVSPFQGGIDHTSHRLFAAGLGPWQMLGAMSLIAAVLSSAAIVSIAMLGDFQLVAFVTITGLFLVGLFEVLVASRLPRRVPHIASDPPAQPKNGPEDGHVRLHLVSSRISSR